MKKLLTLIFALWLSLALYAEFVRVDSEGKDIPSNEATTYFAEWFSVNPSDFVMFNDETDDIGMRHQAYKQYCNGIPLENCILIVHSKDGYVKYVNGDILKSNVSIERKQISSKSEIKRLLKQKNVEPQNIETTIIHVSTPEGEKFVQVYKVETELETQYVDTESGDIIKVVPKIFSSVNTTGQTKYSGLRPLKCDYINSRYYLKDSERNIRVCRTEMDFKNSTYGTRYDFYSSVDTWSGNYLTSVTVKSVKNSWWNATIGDTYPDIYITVTDANDNLVYISDYKLDVGGARTFPVTFRISDMVRIPASGGYKIKVWDYDPVGENDLGFIGSITDNSLGTKTWNNASWNVQMTCEITSWHPALDIMWGLSSVYDYYKQVFNRNSFDNKGALIQGFLHSVSSTSNIKAEGWQTTLFINGDEGQYNNAYAHGKANDVTSAYLHFGLGNELSDTWVDLNTMSHEFTHLICKYRSLGDLEYSGESGALNESMADMMALSIEHYVKPESFNWRFCEDPLLEGGCLRDFQNPQNGLTPQPNTYGVGPYWANPNNINDGDHGGVHSNSGVSNHWYYLLCDGGLGINDKNNSYNVSGIGIEKAQRIVFRALINYFPSQTTFTEARNLTIQSAKDLYPGDENVVKAVTDAWYAVGVGSKYITTKEQITIKVQIPSDWGNTISAWTWHDGSEGFWATLVKDGEWYSYTTNSNSLNIVFVNGTTWAGDANQSIEISVTESTCIQLDDNKSGKRSYTVIDCGPEPDNVVHLPYNEPFTSNIGQFNIVNVNLGGLNYVWQWASANYGMKASAYVNNKNNVTESWLVSPPISLLNIKTATLAFEHAVNKGTTNNLEVMITTDPSGEKWEKLDIPNWPIGTNWTFVPTSVFLDQYVGKIVQIAFVYVSTSSDCPTWEVKKFSVTGTEVASQLVNNPKDANVAAKYIRDGQLFILRDGRFYTIQGVEVK